MCVSMLAHMYGCACPPECQCALTCVSMPNRLFRNSCSRVCQCLLTCVGVPVHRSVNACLPACQCLLTCVGMPALSALSKPATPALLEMTRAISAAASLPADWRWSINACKFVPDENNVWFDLIGCYILILIKCNLSNSHDCIHYSIYKTTIFIFFIYDLLKNII